LGGGGAIHFLAHCKHALFYDYQAEDGKDTAQETQTRPSSEPGGKSGAYSTD
jgi:hypothetical protein